MSALPQLNRGGDSFRPRVEIWSKQIDAPQPPGKRSQQKSPGSWRREAPEVLAEPVPTTQSGRSASSVSIGNAEPTRAVSIAAVRSVVPTTAVALRVAYGLQSVPAPLELVPAHEAPAGGAATGDTALAAGKVHRLAADFYARAPTVGYPGRRAMVGASLDARA